MSKLNLDRDQTTLCRDLAEAIINPVLRYIEYHSTVSIERSALRLIGVQGAREGHPLVNAVLDRLPPAKLALGIFPWFCRALIANPKLTPEQVAFNISKGEISLENLPEAPFDQIEKMGKELSSAASKKIQQVSEKRARLKSRFTKREEGPLKYLIIATGNIYEDILQAQAASELGADIIAVIRSTAQSLLDYVPDGATTEGFGGTYATQKNFQLMREALDATTQKLGRYIGLTNYSSGLCMPEIAVLGAWEGLDYLLNDSMYGILFRDINMKRTFTDQHFSRMICARAGITIQTGEDNYLTTAESHQHWPQVLASQLINEAFAKRAGLDEANIALGHAFEIDPSIEDFILLEIAQAELVRDIFPRSPIKYMPPTKHKTGDIFFANLYDGLFNLTGVMTHQSIQLLGMCTEAIHNPYLMDRFIALKNSNSIFKGARHLHHEIEFHPNGIIVRRARQMMQETLKLLKRIEPLGLMNAIEQGLFAHMPRSKEGGKGLEGIFQKDRNYYNPFYSFSERPASVQRPESRRRQGGARRYRSRPRRNSSQE